MFRANGVGGNNSVVGKGVNRPPPHAIKYIHATVATPPPLPRHCNNATIILKRRIRRHTTPRHVTPPAVTPPGNTAVRRPPPRSNATFGA